MLLVLMLVQAEAGIAALTLGRGEPAARTGPFGDLLLFGALLCRLFAIEELKLLQHGLLLPTARAANVCLWLAIRWRVQVVVGEIRGLLQCRCRWTSAPGNKSQNAVSVTRPRQVIRV